MVNIVHLAVVLSTFHHTRIDVRREVRRDTKDRGAAFMVHEKSLPSLVLVMRDIDPTGKHRVIATRVIDRHARIVQCVGARVWERYGNGMLGLLGRARFGLLGRAHADFAALGYNQPNIAYW